ncbi:hypothetical protein AT575_05960 [Streptococcus penaeicida]|uniref:Uncharacterized protein n=1 Tax=Streptococcus penaeicida TaxID=1765960 RepID=A0A2N8LBC5_9STRE|nr:hypothetical protein [Streptococcus penaeicida]PND47452.1 hypothetical protein AT575_05960 [Streptococcus penaeicida]
MLEILLIVSSLILFLILAFIIIRVNIRNQSSRGHQYIIHFKNLSKTIDLDHHESCKEKMTILAKNPDEDAYSVETQLSAIKLKEFLMKEFQLTLNQVIVSQATMTI